MPRYDDMFQFSGVELVELGRPHAGMMYIATSPLCVHRCSQCARWRPEGPEYYTNWYDIAFRDLYLLHGVQRPPGGGVRPGFWGDCQYGR